jgi:hypothetical protein
MLLRLVLRERERERESTTQNKAEMDGRSEHKCHKLCVPFTTVNWITVRSEIQPIREDKGK